MGTQNINNMSRTWNSGGTTFTAIKFNVTDNASAAASLLFDLQVGGNSKFLVAKAGDVTFTSNDAGASAGPVLTLRRDSATPAASDIIGKLLFQGKDSGGASEDYGEFYATIADPTATSEDASFLFRTKVAGAMTTQATVSATGWNGMTIVSPTITGTGSAAFASATFTAATITTATLSGGSINNTSIGAGTPSSVNATVITSTGAISGASGTFGDGSASSGVSAQLKARTSSGSTWVTALNGSGNEVGIGAGSDGVMRVGGVSSGNDVALMGDGTIRYLIKTSSGHFYPNNDNSYNLGGGSNRFATIFASNGTINTSDQAEKTELRPLDAAEQRAARAMLRTIGVYQWLTAIEAKGALAARLHVGVTAQAVAAALEAEKLDPARYAFWCADEVFETVRTKQTIRREVREQVRQDYVDIVDGQPVTRSRMIEQPKVDMVPLIGLDGRPVLDGIGNRVLDDAGRPVVIGQVPVLDHDGDPMIDADGDMLMTGGAWLLDGGNPVTYPVPVMEDVEVDTEIVAPAGRVRYGVRYEQLAMWLIRALAQMVEEQATRMDAFEQRLAALEAA